MKKIVVCYDFTPEATHAMQYASIIGEAMQASIVMLHITENSSDEIPLEQRLEEEKRKFSYKYEIDTDVWIGDLTSSVRQYAEMNKAMLVVMGKKERSGMERIFGSKTLKMVMGSKIPFIIVKDAPKFTKIRKIMFPISFETMNKAKLRWVQIFSQYFHLDVELFLQHTNDEDSKIDTRANFLFAKRYLDRYCINRTENTAPEDMPFREAVVKHAKDINADLILIMTSGSASFIDYMLGLEEEYVIENNNNNIPVMCISPNLDIMRFKDFA